VDSAVVATNDIEHARTAIAQAELLVLRLE
jgi:hypothetical protein